MAKGCIGLFAYWPSGASRPSDVACGGGCGPTATCSCGRHRVEWGSASPATEGHLTVAFGDGVHACAAAVNGATLAVRDPQRQRVAFVWNASDETLAILSHTWRIERVLEPKGGARGRKAVVLDGGSRPLSRAIFWDTDHLVMPRDGKLEKLWDFAPHSSLVATPESPGCFNSGFFMFRPSAHRRAEYEALLTSGLRVRRCDKGWRPLTDQSYLNVLYDAHAYRTNFAKLLRRMRANESMGGGAAVSGYTPLDPLVWKVRTPFGSIPNDHHGCLNARAEFERITDSFHFFDRMAPWHPNASYFLSSMHIDPQCSGQAVAGEFWREMLAGLPDDVQRVCRGRLERFLASGSAYNARKP